MISYQRKTTGNSRLVYKELNGREADWPGEREVIRQLVMDSATLKLASNDTLFYFFSALPSESSIDFPCWVGMEIVGPFEDNNDFELHSYDLDAGEVLSFPLTTLSLKFSWSDLDYFYQVAKKVLESERQGIAETWRLRLETHYQEDEQVSFKLFLEFFPK